MLRRLNQSPINALTFLLRFFSVSISEAFLPYRADLPRDSSAAWRRRKARQAELLVRELGGAVGILPVDDDGDLDLGGRDQLDVDPGFAQAVEQARGHARVRPHPDPDHAELRYSLGRE